MNEKLCIMNIASPIPKWLTRSRTAFSSSLAQPVHVELSVLDLPVIEDPGYVGDGNLDQPAPTSDRVHRKRSDPVPVGAEED